MLVNRLRSHPADIVCIFAHARVPMERRDWDAAVARWRPVLRDFPDRLEGYEGILRCLREAGPATDATGILTEGLQRFPSSETILLEAAHHARQLSPSLAPTKITPVLSVPCALSAARVALQPRYAWVQTMNLWTPPGDASIPSAS
jgi:hypothetical protein